MAFATHGLLAKAAAGAAAVVGAVGTGLAIRSHSTISPGCTSLPGVMFSQ